ncbi:unnamed protein product [Strongylus vulgaris]|uniref:Uncharacterized protein n=1 Tax=Strongylus vulgaris TaxID=40348 RepID=A0A3P7LBZ7_STRVU|nr:unnamed protein product [Strongylus vulgaris]
MPEEGSRGPGMDQKSGMRTVSVSLASYLPDFFMVTPSSRRKNTGGGRGSHPTPKAGKEDLPPCWRIKYDGVRFEELLTTCGWPTEEDSTKDYDLLFRGSFSLLSVSQQRHILTLWLRQGSPNNPQSAGGTFSEQYVSKAKHRWAALIIRRTDDRWTLRTLEWITREENILEGGQRSDVLTFVALMVQLNSQLVTSDGSGPRERRRRRSISTSWMTLARDRKEWK